MAGRIGVGPADFISPARVPDGARVVGVGPNDFNNVWRVDVGGSDTTGPDEKNPENLIIPGPGSVTFSTDFAGDGALSGDWTKVPGTPGTVQRVGGRAQVTVDGVAGYTAPTTGSANHFAAHDYAGPLSYLMVRATTLTNYIGLRWGSGFFQLIPFISGSAKAVLVAMPEPAPGTRMELRVLNGRVTAFLGGDPVPNMVDIDVSGVPTGNLCGIRAQPGSVGVSDNFACGTIVA